MLKLRKRKTFFYLEKRKISWEKKCEEEKKVRLKLKVCFLHERNVFYQNYLKFKRIGNLKSSVKSHVDDFCENFVHKFAGFFLVFELFCLFWCQWLIKEQKGLLRQSTFQDYQ